MWSVQAKYTKKQTVKNGLKGVKAFLKIVELVLVLALFLRLIFRKKIFNFLFSDLYSGPRLL